MALSMINKGFISSIDETQKTAVVIPQEASGNVTFPLVIPYFLTECLQVNMPVVYATFPDNTGIILARLDGEWNHKIYKTLTVEGVTHMTDKLTADNGITATGGISASGGISATGGGNVTVQGDISLSGSISASGSLSAGGDVSAGSISLTGHVHSGVMAGSDDTQPPK